MISDEYAAGFFDGEGCVTACIITSVGVKRRPSPTIVVCISNTNRAILELHKEKWGGSLYERGGKSKQKVMEGKWQPLFQWKLGARQAVPFLKAILPYVFIKKDVVEAAIRYTQLMATPHSERIDYGRTTERGGRRWVSPVTKPEFRERVIKIHDEIKALNRKSAPFNALRGTGKQVSL